MAARIYPFVASILLEHPLSARHRNKVDGDNPALALGLAQFPHVKGEKTKAIRVGTLLVSHRKCHSHRFRPNPFSPPPGDVQGGARECASPMCDFFLQRKIAQPLVWSRTQNEMNSKCLFL